MKPFSLALWTVATLLWLGIAGWLLAGCAPLHPAPTHPIYVTVRDSQTQQSIVTATGTLSTGESCATVGLRLQCLTTAVGSATLTVRAPDYQDGTKAIGSLSVPEQGELELARIVTRPFPAESGPLHRDGEYFKTADGRIWDWRGATMFLLPCRYYRGEDIQPDIDWMVAHGVNVARVFIAGVSGSGWQWAPWLPECRRPWERYGDFPQKARAFNDKLAASGVRTENTVGTDDDVSAETYHGVIQSVYDALAGTELSFVEWMNEPWVASRQSTVVRIRQLGINRHGLLSTYGIDPDAGAFADVLDYLTRHQARDYAHFVQVPKELQETRDLFHVPVVGDEPLGVADFERVGAGARTNNIDYLVQHFYTCRLFAAGCTIHSQFGLEGRKPSAAEPISEQIVSAITEVWKFVPGEAQAGAYLAPHINQPMSFPLGWVNNQSSEVNHAYAKPVGDRVYAINLRPTAGWMPVGVNGWTVDATMTGFPYLVRLR